MLSFYRRTIINQYVKCFLKQMKKRVSDDVMNVLLKLEALAWSKSRKTVMSALENCECSLRTAFGLSPWESAQ